MKTDELIRLNDSVRTRYPPDEQRDTVMYARSRNVLQVDFDALNKVSVHSTGVLGSREDLLKYFDAERLSVAFTYFKEARLPGIYIVERDCSEADLAAGQLSLNVVYWPHDEAYGSEPSKGNIACTFWRYVMIPLAKILCCVQGRVLCILFICTQVCGRDVQRVHCAALC